MGWINNTSQKRSSASRSENVALRSTSARGLLGLAFHEEIAPIDPLHATDFLRNLNRALTLGLTVHNSCQTHHPAVGFDADRKRARHRVRQQTGLDFCGDGGVIDYFPRAPALWGRCTPRHEQHRQPNTYPPLTPGPPSHTDVLLGC